MEIVRAIEGDAVRIAEMEKEYIECPWSEETVRSSIACERYAFFKAVEKGKIIGYIGVERCIDEGNICNVAVDARFRRKGVAFSLLSAVIDFCEQCGIAKLYLEVNENNGAAIGLYEKLGFKRLSVRPKYYGQDSALVMIKQLSKSNLP